MGSHPIRYCRDRRQLTSQPPPAWPTLLEIVPAGDGVLATADHRQRLSNVPRGRSAWWSSGGPVEVPRCGQAQVPARVHSSKITCETLAVPLLARLLATMPLPRSEGAFEVEPPIGIEPMTYALREACARAAMPLPAQTARQMAPEALIPPELYSVSSHDPFHAATPGSFAAPPPSRCVASKASGRGPPPQSPRPCVAHQVAEPRRTSVVRSQSDSRSEFFVGFHGGRRLPVDPPLIRAWRPSTCPMGRLSGREQRTA